MADGKLNVRMHKRENAMSSYHYGVNSTYPGTGQHGVDELWDHGQVDGNPVSLFHTFMTQTGYQGFTAQE